VTAIRDLMSAEARQRLLERLAAPAAKRPPSRPRCLPQCSGHRLNEITMMTLNEITSMEDERMPTTAPERTTCLDHRISHEVGDSCYHCLRDPAKGSAMAEQIRKQPSTAYALGAESATVMLHWARHVEDLALYVACRTSLDENKPVEWSALRLPSLPPGVPPIQ
jgi:hypothetical protein